MSPTVWTVITAMVAGGAALGGSLGGIALKNRAESNARRDQRLFANQDSAVEAIATLLEVLGAHYAAMWDLEAARVRGEQAEIESTLAASLITRGAVTRPHTVAKSYIPALATRIDETVKAVYAMDSATDASRTAETVEARRAAAREAQRRLERETLTYFGQVGVGLPV